MYQHIFHKEYTYSNHGLFHSINHHNVLQFLTQLDLSDGYSILEQDSEVRMFDYEHNSNNLDYDLIREVLKSFFVMRLLFLNASKFSFHLQLSPRRMEYNYSFLQLRQHKYGMLLLLHILQDDKVSVCLHYACDTPQE